MLFSKRVYLYRNVLKITLIILNSYLCKGALFMSVSFDFLFSPSRLDLLPGLCGRILFFPPPALYRSARGFRLLGWHNEPQPTPRPKSGALTAKCLPLPSDNTPASLGADCLD